MRTQNERLFPWVCYAVAIATFAVTVWFLRWSVLPVAVSTSLAFFAAKFGCEFFSQWQARRLYGKYLSIPPLEESPEVLVEVWRMILKADPPATWILFSYGTCVIFPERIQNPELTAIDFLAEFGPAMVATASADFSVRILDNQKGFVVSCHHPQIFNYVRPELWGEESGEAMVGLFARMDRGWDAHVQKIIHVGNGAA